MATRDGFAKSNYYHLNTVMLNPEGILKIQYAYLEISSERTVTIYP